MEIGSVLPPACLPPAEFLTFQKDIFWVFKLSKNRSYLKEKQRMKLLSLLHADSHSSCPFIPLVENYVHVCYVAHVFFHMEETVYIIP